MFRPIHKTNIFRPTQIKHDPSYSGDRVPSCPVKHLLSGEICSYPGKHIPPYLCKHVSVLSQENIFRPTQVNMFPSYPRKIYSVLPRKTCFRLTQETYSVRKTYSVLPRKTYYVSVLPKSTYSVLTRKRISSYPGKHVSVLPRTIIIIVIIMSISMAHDL